PVGFDPGPSRTPGSRTMTPSVRILRKDDVRAALPMPAWIDAVEAAFVAYSSGAAELPDVIHLDVPEARGEIHVKAGHLHGAPAYAVKVSSGFSGVDPPALDGLVVVFDARTGAPTAFLLDGGFVTDQRTGAAGGVAARWLAPERVDVVAVIGTGVQARKQVEALRVIGPELGRTDEDQLTVIDLTGVGVQDVAASNAVLANLRRDAGEWFRL